MSERIAIEVQYRVDTEGNISPLCIIWDDGREFPIERVLHACILEDDTVVGVRYTVLIYGKQKQLYHLSDDKWYVAA